MTRKILFVIAVLVLISPLLSADSFELKLKKIKVNKKNAEMLPEMELRPAALSGISSEPRYRSDYPQKFKASFGDGDGIDVAFAVDEKRGSGKGFDFLYVDVNGGGDLSGGKKLSGKSSNRGYSYLDTSFSKFDIEIPSGGGIQEYPVQARFSIQRNQTNNSSLYLMPLCVLEGDIQFGETQCEIVVFDSNCNGVFGEKGSPGGRRASGDRVWIGKKAPKVEDAYVEALPLGKYYLFEDQYYEIEFGSQSQVDINRADVPLGTVKVNNPGFLLELVQGNSVLYANNEKGTEVKVPVGSYRVNNAGFRLRHKGQLWELEGQPGSCTEQFTVMESEVSEISVGPPLKIMVTADMRNEGNGVVASLDFYIAGSAGEKYKYLREGGKKVDLPEISIRNSKGKEVEEGRFEYG